MLTLHNGSMKEKKTGLEVDECSLTRVDILSGYEEIELPKCSLRLLPSTSQKLRALLDESMLKSSDFINPP